MAVAFLTAHQHHARKRAANAAYGDTFEEEQDEARLLRPRQEGEWSSGRCLYVPALRPVARPFSGGTLPSTCEPQGNALPGTRFSKCVDAGVHVVGVPNVSAQAAESDPLFVCLLPNRLDHPPLA